MMTEVSPFHIPLPSTLLFGILELKVYKDSGMPPFIIIAMGHGYQTWGKPFYP